jgi:hypothetical protein
MISLFAINQKLRGGMEKKKKKRINGGPYFKYSYQTMFRVDPIKESDLGLYGLTRVNSSQPKKFFKKYLRF